MGPTSSVEHNMAHMLSKLSSAMELRNRFGRLDPIHFTAVMATGIVSIAALYAQQYETAIALFYINVALLALLSFLATAAWLFGKRTNQELPGDNQRVVVHLAIPAAICVVGNQFILLARNYLVATLLCVIGTVLWVLWMYAVLLCLSGGLRNANGCGMIVSSETASTRCGARGGKVIDAVHLQPCPDSTTKPLDRRI